MQGAGREPITTGGTQLRRREALVFLEEAEDCRQATDAGGKVRQKLGGDTRRQALEVLGAALKAKRIQRVDGHCGASPGEEAQQAGS
jgi:hypothetical protein